MAYLRKKSTNLQDCFMQQEVMFSDSIEFEVSLAAFVSG